VRTHNEKVVRGAGKRQARGCRAVAHQPYSRRRQRPTCRRQRARAGARWRDRPRTRWPMPARRCSDLTRLRPRRGDRRAIPARSCRRPGRSTSRPRTGPRASRAVCFASVCPSCLFQHPARQVPRTGSKVPR
jgi:hypothetical protein